MNFMGIDYHKKHSQVTVLNEAGEVIFSGRMPNRADVVEGLFRRLEPPTTAVLEATRNWINMYDLLEGLADEVKLAHPLKVKAIAWAKIKTDEIDSRVLADFLRAGLVPEAHIPGQDVRQARSILRQRMFLVKMRTMVKNRIHTLADRHPDISRYPGMKTDLFSKAGLRWLGEVEFPGHERRLLDSELQLLMELNRLIKGSDAWVREFSRDNEEVRLLKTIPGIGDFIALLLWSEIDGAGRFRSDKKLHSYAGLVPGTYASGDRVRHGHLTRHGNKWIRWAMVEASIPAIRSDFGLRCLYERIKQKKDANTAKIVVARRLLTIAHRVLTEGRPYYQDDGPLSVDNSPKRIYDMNIPAAPGQV